MSDLNQLLLIFQFCEAYIHSDLFILPPVPRLWVISLCLDTLLKEEQLPQPGINQC